MTKLTRDLKLTFNKMNPIDHSVTELARYEFSGFNPYNDQFLYYDKCRQYIANNSIYVELSSSYAQYSQDEGPPLPFPAEVFPCNYIIKFIKQGTNLVINTVSEIPEFSGYSDYEGGNTRFVPVHGTCFGGEGFIYSAYIYEQGRGQFGVVLCVHDANSLEKVKGTAVYDTGASTSGTYGQYYYKDDQRFQEFILFSPIKLVASESYLACLVPQDSIVVYSLHGDSMIRHRSIELSDDFEIPVSDLIRIEGTKLYTDAGIIDLQNVETDTDPNAMYTKVDPSVNAIIFSSETTDIAVPLSVSTSRREIFIP